MVFGITIKWLYLSRIEACRQLIKIAIGCAQCGEGMGDGESGTVTVTVTVTVAATVTRRCNKQRGWANYEGAAAPRPTNHSAPWRLVEWARRKQGL